MGEITTTSHAIVPVSQVPISIRPATLADVPFMDRLQKTHSKQLGYFPTKQFEGYVELGAVLVAVGARPASRGGEAASDSTLRVDRDAGVAATEEKLGYIISRDRYLKRDELGVIYQLCVAPGTQRKLVGASLVAEVFRRSAYGCKLYCCWCAQDIAANYFWESLGFVPIAFRAGSTKKSRVHIFWQRRVHVDDVTTPWWYPCATNGGAIREDRLVFPIPPGVHWKDVCAPVLSKIEGVVSKSDEVDHPISGYPQMKDETGEKLPARRDQKPVVKQKRAGEAPTPRRVQFGAPSAQALAMVEKSKKKPPFDKAQGRSQKRAKVKNDPALVAKARELRDRWMDQLNAHPGALLALGKYEVARQLTTEAARAAEPMALLEPAKVLDASARAA